jgi:nucleoside-diphosphate-sugar epimerase
MNIKDKTLLITGIGNFVGLRAAEMAIARGIKVCGLEASEEKARSAKALGIPVTIGRTSEPEILDRVCQEIDIVFHTQYILDPAGAIDSLRPINVGGTANMARAAQKAGVKTFLLLSSIAVYGFKYPDRISEEIPLQKQKNGLCQTLIEAEKEILKFNNPPDFGVTIVRGGDIYGPGAEIWILEPIKLMRKKFFALVNGDRSKIDRVYVDNLIDGVFLAAEKECYGQTFNITDGSRTSLSQFYNLLAEMVGESKPISMPFFAAKAAAKTAGKQIGILPESIDFLNRPHTCSIEKASRLLGYQPQVSLEEGMAKTTQWLRNHNFLK